MLNKRAERYTKDLQDPTLAALLRDAMGDDPVCAESPGRTDFIMRKVLAAGVRPAARRHWWGPLALATGSLATAAAAVMLLLGSVHLPSSQEFAVFPQENPPAVHPHPALPHIQSTPVYSVPKVPEVKEALATPWNEVPATPHGVQSKLHPAGQSDKLPLQEHATLSTPDTAEPPASTQQVAAALYDAGAAAHAVGDYTTAYDAYQASYELEPTPDALLASGNALEQIAKETLNSEEPST